jgi:hypothetical protein
LTCDLLLAFRACQCTVNQQHAHFELTADMRRIAVDCLLAVWLVASCLAGEFQNLGFDDAANLGGAPDPRGGFPVEVALPGWTLRSGGEQHLGIVVNLPMSSGLFSGVNEPIAETRFALLLLRESTNVPPFTLEQSGTVPPNSKYLVYRYRGGDLVVQVNGVTLSAMNYPPNHFASLTTNLVYDVSAFAGQEVKLAFIGPVGPFIFPGTTSTWAAIDSIRFVTEPPRLNVRPVGNHLELSWPDTAQGYVLQTASTLNAPTVWLTPNLPVIVGNGLQTVIVPLGPEPQYYRLAVACRQCGR